MNNFSLAQACLGARSCLQVCPVKGKCTVELGCYASISQLLAVIAKQFFQKLDQTKLNACGCCWLPL